MAVRNRKSMEKYDAGTHAKSCVQCRSYTKCLLSVTEQREIKKPDCCFWKSYMGSRDITVILKYLKGLSKECMHPRMGREILDRLETVYKRSLSAGTETEWEENITVLKEWYTLLLDKAITEQKIGDYIDRHIKQLVIEDKLSDATKKSITDFEKKKQRESAAADCNGMYRGMDSSYVYVPWSSSDPEIAQVYKEAGESINKILLETKNRVLSRCNKLAKEHGIIFDQDWSKGYSIGKFYVEKAK